MSKVNGTIKLTANAVVKLSRLFLVIFLVLFAVSVYEYLLKEIFNGRGVLIPFVLIWALTAYIVLPWVHRFLTKFYIPNYFVGRTRTSDGFYGDPVNIALIGSEEKLRLAMKKAGWHEAEELNTKTTWKMIYCSVFKKSYKTAPVSSLFLFNRKQDFAYQKEVNGNPHARHHVRFWSVPEKWWLPGGYKTEWLAAATYDRRVGVSTLTGQITHKIEENTDIERDFVVTNIKKIKLAKEVEYKKHFTSSFRDRNGGGDRIQTDGSLPFVVLK